MGREWEKERVKDQGRGRLGETLKDREYYRERERESRVQRERGKSRGRKLKEKRENGNTCEAFSGGRTPHLSPSTFLPVIHTVMHIGGFGQITQESYRKTSGSRLRDTREALAMDTIIIHLAINSAIEYPKSVFFQV